MKIITTQELVGKSSERTPTLCVLLACLSSISLLGSSSHDLLFIGKTQRNHLLQIPGNFTFLYCPHTHTQIPPLPGRKTSLFQPLFSPRPNIDGKLSVFHYVCVILAGSASTAAAAAPVVVAVLLRFLVVCLPYHPSPLL